MSTKSSYLIDKTVSASVEELIDIFDIRGTHHELALHQALSLHDMPFLLTLHRFDKAQFTPLQDSFTFNMDTDELILYADDPEALIDAVLEMAMFQRGFNTVMGIDDDWKIQIAIGAWRSVREHLKDDLGIERNYGKVWSVEIGIEQVRRYNVISFGAMVFLASRSDVDLVFPAGANKTVVDTYHRIVQIIDAISLNVSVEDYLLFNQRLGRALTWIEENIAPQSTGGNNLFDDLFGPKGDSGRLLDDGFDLNDKG